MRRATLPVARARAVVALAATLVALSLAACSSSTRAGAGAAATTTVVGAATPAAGGTSPSTTEGPKAKTLAEAPKIIAADSGVTDAQATCIVDKLVAAVGPDTALTIVNDSSDITARAPAERKAAADALFGCIDKQDFAKTAADSFYAQYKDSGITRAQADCIGGKLIDVLTPEGLLGLSSTALDDATMNPDTQAKLLQVITGCVPSGVLGQLGTGDAGPTTTAKG